ncbi:hemoblobin-interacting domain-containing protein [Cohnella sp. GCM10012308]|uniref:hemoblobin-interacting domain-containing protein n=1 Tax=Cohnella sp. GCM10012308 TaxID=3317329 RepID=UPI003609C247
MKKVSVFLMLALLVFAGFSYAPTASANPEPLDIVPPAFVGAQNQGYQVYLYFDENISPVLPADADPNDESQYEAWLDALPGQIQIAQDGEHFAPLLNGIAYTYLGSNYLQIYYEQDQQVISGPNTKIKLAAGLLQDETGNIAPEMILSVSAPAIQSVTASNGNRDITVKFNGDVYRTPFTDSDRDIATIVTSKGSYLDLGASDKATLQGDTLTLELAKPLYGETSQILIRGGTVQDANGNYNTYDEATPYIQLSDSQDDATPPKLVNYVFSNDYQDLTLIFDEDVQVTDEDALRESLNWFDSNHWGWYRLPEEADIIVSGSLVTIHNDQPTDRSIYRAYSLRGIADLAGNAAEEFIYTKEFYFEGNNEIRLDDYNAHFSMDGRFLNLYFSADYDAPELDDEASAVEALKGKIQISRDNCATFTSLSAEDKLFVKYNRISVIFKDAVKTGSIQLKIAEGELTDRHHYSSNEDINITIAYNGPDLAGYLFSNADSALTFNDNKEWRKNVNAVTVYDDYSETGRVLAASEYDLTAGKLTIRKGVIARDRYYYVTVEAQGYSARIYEGYSLNSTDVFYMTSPALSTIGGVTAKVFIYNQANDKYNQEYNGPSLKSSGNPSNSTGTQSVVFELFDGDTPVSIAATELAVGTGTYTAKFNVSNAAAKNYTVKAFVVSSFDSDTLNLGINLGTVKTQSEIDDAMIQNSQATNNNNHP